MSERSKGKMRPSLPRSGDLRSPARTGCDRTPNHASNGRFTAGNKAATDRSAKQAIAKTLGLRPGDDVVDVVARDAARVNGVVLRDMPSDAPTVRNLVALLARHSAIAAYFNVQADRLGLDTPEGSAALEQAMKHGARVERLTVTTLDVATKLAATDRSRPIDAHALAATAFAAPTRMPSAERAPALSINDSSENQNASARRAGSATGGDE